MLECVNLALAHVDFAPIDMQKFEDSHDWPLAIEEDEWPPNLSTAPVAFRKNSCKTLRKSSATFFMIITPFRQDERHCALVPWMFSANFTPTVFSL